MTRIPVIHRRSLCALAAIVTACGCGASQPDERLQMATGAPSKPATLGLQPLKLGGSRDALLYVPTTYVPAEPLPLLVLLHGAGGSASNWFGSYADRAESARFVMLAPDSRGSTWDGIHGAFGADVEFINRALESVASQIAVDRNRMALVGFSDGATYALSLGLANGDLFTHVVAYSPGFVVQSTPRGKAKYFFSHGTGDPILPIDNASRALVTIFRSQGYQVDFVEFDGGHEVPAAISTQALGWLAADW